MLTTSKLNSIEALVSQALIDMGISHEEFIVIFKEEDKWEKMKENVRYVSEKQENMKLNSVTSRKRASSQLMRGLKTKNKVKNSQKLRSILRHRTTLFLLCVYV